MKQKKLVKEHLKMEMFTMNIGQTELIVVDF